MKVIPASSLEFVPSSHDDPRDPGALKKMLFSCADLPKGRVQMVNYAQLPKGKAFRNHYHEKMSEVFVISTGAIAFMVEGERVELATGDALLVDAGERHWAENIGYDDVYYFCFGIVSAEGGKTVVVE